MCLSQGIHKESLQTISSNENEYNNDMNIPKIIKNPSIIPPRREIQMIKRFYRNQHGIRGEYQSAISH